MPDTEDVSTTPRKRLSPRQRLALFERRKGICCVCGKKIRGEFIDEHWRALGLGGPNDPSNRDIAHPKCAALKTRDDMARINKAKNQKSYQHGIKAVARPLKSRNDLPKGQQAEKRAKDRLPLPSLPTAIERRFGVIPKGKG